MADLLSLYGGRFAHEPVEAMAALSRSTHFDWALAPYDIAQSKAHAGALHRAGLLGDAEAAAILAALSRIAAEAAAGSFAPNAEDEDVHTALERRLLEITGEDTGGRLRAGRSRNDQVATDFRMYLRDNARGIASAVLDLASAVRDQASRHVDDPAPGFTHLQRAQPVSFGHELGKHVQALLRDVERLQDWDRRAALSPMGAGALSGSSLALDPAGVAAELGFDGVLANSIDAVSDRDFVAEFLFATAMLGVHLSRIGEEICLWASAEFGWVELDDRFATGSSIMPQKKNPDSAELARGKSGRLIGNLIALMTAAKGMPFAYNRDLQEDKEPAMDSIATLSLVLPALTGTVATLRFRTQRMAETAPLGFSLATEVADWLVLRGVPFRQAHDASGACVKLAEAAGCDLDGLTDEQFASAHPLLGPEVREALDVGRALASRSGPGGTAPARVREQLREAGGRIDAMRSWSQDNPVAAAILR